MPLIFQGPKEPCPMESCSGVGPAQPGWHVSLPAFGASRKLLHLCSFLTKALARATCRFPGPALDQSQGCSCRVGCRAVGAQGVGVQGRGCRAHPCRMCHPGGPSLQKPRPPLEVPWMQRTLPGAPEVGLAGAALLTQMSADVSLHEPGLLFPWRGTTLF